MIETAAFKAWLFAARLIIPFAFLVLFIGAIVWNDTNRNLDRRDLATCVRAGSHFVLTEIKGTEQCVDAEGARKLHLTSTVTTVGMVAFAICFLTLFYAHRTSRSKAIT